MRIKNTGTEEMINNETDGQKKIPPSLPRAAMVGNAVLFCAFCSTVVMLVWRFLPDNALPFSKTSIIGFSLITLTRLFLSLLLPIVFFARRYRIQDKHLLGRYPGAGALLLSFLIGCPSALILVSIHNLLLRLWVTQGVSLALPAFFYATSDTSRETEILILITAFLIPVLLQELFFRGLFFSVWPQNASAAPKILLSGLLFALFMQNPVDFIPLLLLGFLLAYVRQTTGHFLSPVITQAAMLLSYYLFLPLITYQDYSPAIVAAGLLDTASLYTSIAALVMSLLAFLPVLAQLRRMSRDTEQIAVYSKETSKESIRGSFGWSFWFGLILFAAAWVIQLGI